MASSKEFRDFVLEELNALGEITSRAMMGEYLLYYKGVLFGGIYDDRMLVKITETNAKFEMKKVSPYENAKDMFLVEDVDDSEKVCEIVLQTYWGLIKK